MNESCPTPEKASEPRVQWTSRVRPRALVMSLASGVWALLSLACVQYLARATRWESLTETDWLALAIIVFLPFFLISTLRLWKFEQPGPLRLINARGFLLLFGITLVAVFVAPIYLSEPRYEGRSLRSWLADVPAEGPADLESWIALRTIGTNAIPRLLDMMEARDPKVRQRWTKLLQRQSILQPKVPDAEQQRQLAISGFALLGRRADPAIPALAVLLRDADVAVSAAEALGRISARAVPALLTAVDHDDPDVQQAVIFSLSRFGADAEPAVERVLEQLSSRSARVRRAAARALGKIGQQPGECVPALAERLHDKDRVVRACAARALGEFGRTAQSALRGVLDACHDDNEMVRAMAAEAVGKIEGDPETIVPVLMQEFARARGTVKVYIINTLARCGSSADEAIPLLEEAAGSDDPWVRSAAEDALAKLQ